MVNAHERTPQIRKFRITRLCTEYETFKIESGESHKDMITRFTTIVNELVSLGKIFTIEELIDKVLSTLPKSWR